MNAEGPAIGAAEAPSAHDAPAATQALRVQLCIIIFAVDCLAIVAGAMIGNLMRFSDAFADTGLQLCALALPIYVGIGVNSGAFSDEILGDWRAGFSRAALAYLFAIGAVLFLAFYLKVSSEASRMSAATTMVTTFMALALGRYACDLYIRARTGMRLVNELYICDGPNCEPPPGMPVLDAAAHGLTPNLQDPMMLDRLSHRLRGLDRVVVSCPSERRPIWALLLKGMHINGEIVSGELSRLGAFGIGTAGAKATLAVATAPLDLRQRAIKRTLDLALAIPGLIFLAPLLVATAIAIKLETRGPVFFVQTRVGRGNMLFRMFKFRSMRVETCDPDGATSTSRDDDRVTRVGRLIRQSSIDELPQLFNVLRGEMSLVGPRPHALGSLAGNKLFWEVDERYWLRHASKPGLTGLAQVRGYRGETREREDLSNRLRADLEYIAGWTIWRDVSILVSTLRVLVHRNAY